MYKLYKSLPDCHNFFYNGGQNHANHLQYISFQNNFMKDHSLSNIFNSAYYKMKHGICPLKNNGTLKCTVFWLLSKVQTNIFSSSHSLFRTPLVCHHGHESEKDIFILITFAVFVPTLRLSSITLLQSSREQGWVMCPLPPSTHSRSFSPLFLSSLIFF